MPHRSTVLALVLTVAALTGLVGWRSVASSSSGGAPVVAGPSAHDASFDPPGELPVDRHGALGLADGELPDGVTAFDDEYPAVVELDPELLDALRRASTAASSDGTELVVNSGWRSAAYQEQLLAEAVAEYGSRAEAARWVATPTTSPHVSGDAVDIGGTDATAWLAEHGAQYGLCRIYSNEPWHFELRPEAVDHGCPAMYADPTHDPRMQQ